MGKWRFALVLACVVGAVGALALGGPALAQTPTPNQINAVAKDLWCPLCNGVRLDNCDLQACIQMREVIAQKLTAGESKEQIKAYFVQQYGDVVLGRPSGEGFNLVAWILPVLVGLVGIGWLAYLVWAWSRRSQERQTQRGSSSNTISSQQGRDTSKPDEYMKRVDDELRKYQP